MELTSKENPVARLWCLANHDLMSCFLNHQRFLRTNPIYKVGERDKPNRSFVYGKHAFIICSNHGEYSGFFGSPVEVSDVSGRDFEEEIAKKHPKWSRAKVLRVAADQLKNSRKSSLEVRFDEARLNKILEFAKILCLQGDVTLVLDDGGTISQDIDGTLGLPYELRKPHCLQWCTINTRNGWQSLRKCVPLRFWSPVLVTQHADGRETDEV